MIKQHIKTLPHHPKRVIVVSLIVALVIGIFGYIKINDKSFTSISTDKQDATNNQESLSPKSLTLGFLAGGRIKTVSVKSGDEVKKGQVLAELDAENVVGSLNQAKAAYAIAQANYQKLLNGATNSTIEVARAAVNTAKVNLDQVTAQQKILVDNAYRTLLNSTPEAVPDDNDDNYTAPIISGNYILGKEGIIKLHFYYSSGGIGFNVDGGLTSGNGSCNTITSQPIANTGLFIKCNSDIIDTKDWNINIPNKKAANYLTNYNAYQLAIQTQQQAVNNSQAALDQANASLNSVLSTARQEDIQTAEAQMNSALGAVQIAQSAYDNTIITAPADGTITSVIITPGQIATANASAIELKITSSSN